MPYPRKIATLRQRRNRPAEIILLPSEKNPRRYKPKLPENPRKGQEWTDEARTFWREAWASPMASQWTRSDELGILILVMMINDFYTSPAPTASLIKEIRSWVQAYGLSSDRNTLLDWIIPISPTMKHRGPMPTAPQLPQKSENADPRDVLND
jgi:hypothetical protein